MQPADIIAIVVIVLMIAAASFYIIKAKKSGKKCIGCPYGKTCSSCNGCESEDNGHE